MKKLTATVEKQDGKLKILSPGVGLWRDPPVEGGLLRAGMTLGALEVLGEVWELVMPDGAFGVVIDVFDPTRARTPVEFKTALVTLDPEVAGGSLAVEEAEAETSGTAQFLSPMSGRFYERPGPDKPPFVQAGDVIGPGQTICLLEVMKTFNRITYSGDRVRVLRVVPQDGDDLNAKDPILELEEA